MKLREKKTRNVQWLNRLVDKITRNDIPLNCAFLWWNGKYDVCGLSNTQGYSSYSILEQVPSTRCHSTTLEITAFFFDFWTKELGITSYRHYDERATIIKAFKRIYPDCKVIDYVAGQLHDEEKELHEHMTEFSYKYDQKDIENQKQYVQYLWDCRNGGRTDKSMVWV